MNQGVEFVPSGEPLELNSFTPYLTKHDRRVDKNARLPNPSTRRPMFSVGISVDKEDQLRLPKLSATKIVDYLDEHYVSVQARIQKDAATGALYLHHRPIVVTAKYGAVRLTEDFTPAVANSVREMHSLGVYLPTSQPPKPANLRHRGARFTNTRRSKLGSPRGALRGTALRIRVHSRPP